MKTEQQPAQSMREFFERPDIRALQQIQKENPHNSSAHLQATLQIEHLATEIGAGRYFTPHADKATQIASAFIRVLEEWLTASQMRAVVRRNAAARMRGDDSTCATHDFCDANEAMDEAFRRATGRAATESGGEGIGCMSDDDSALFEKAWSLAKAAKFQAANL